MVSTQLRVLSGLEPFHSDGAQYRDALETATVLDFWRWGYSRLLADVTRGVLAEFVVARLIACDMTVPGSPDLPYDCETRDHRRVEVKSSAYVEDWDVTRPRTDAAIAFSGLKCKLFTAGAGFAATAEYHADLFVFCLLTTKPSLPGAPPVDPLVALDLTQWDFYVLTRPQLEAIGSPDRISLNRLKGIAQVCKWQELAQRVAESALHEPTAESPSPTSNIQHPTSPT